MTESSIIGDFDAALLAKETENSCLKQVTRVMHIAIPPFYLNNISKAVAIALNKEIEYYCHELSGVPVAFNKKKVKLLSQNGVIIPGQPKIHTDFEAEFIVFSPSVGDTLKGIVHKLNPKTFGCLVHGYFYASVRYYQTGSSTPISVELGDDVVIKVIKLDEDGGGYMSIFGECLSKTSSGRTLFEIDSGIDDGDRDANPPVQQQFGSAKVFSDEESLSSTSTKVSQPEISQTISQSTEKEAEKSSDSISFNDHADEEFVRPRTANETIADSSLFPEVSKKDKKKKKKDKKDKREKKDKKEKKKSKKAKDGDEEEKKKTEEMDELEILREKLKKLEEKNQKRKEKKQKRRQLENAIILSSEASCAEDDVPTHPSVPDLNNTDLSSAKKPPKKLKKIKVKKEKIDKDEENPGRKRKRKAEQVAAAILELDRVLVDSEPSAKHRKKI